ncbi:MAG: hypothetical protein Fur0010_06040 [Bdellovibrio sp.]
MGKHIIILIFLSIVVVFKQANACTVETLTSEIQAKIPEKYKVKVHIGKYGVYAVVPEFNLIETSDDGKKIEEALKEYGPKAGNGWRIENNCARVLFLKGETTASWCEGEAPPPEPTNKLSMEAKIVTETDGKLSCQVGLKFENQNIDPDSPKNDVEQEIISSLTVVKTGDFEMDCQKLLCRPKVDGTFGSSQVLAKFGNETVHAECNFIDLDLDSVKIEFEKGVENEKAFCRAKIKISGKNGQGNMTYEDKLPESIGTVSWDSSARCTDLKCQSSTDGIKSIIKVKVKEKDYEATCEVEGKAATPTPDPNADPDDEDLDLPPPARLEYDPKKGGRPVQMPQPIPIPPDTGPMMMMKMGAW